MSLMPQPARTPSQNARHAATFFALSLVVLALPVFIPSSRRPTAPPSPLRAQASPPAAATTPAALAVAESPSPASSPSQAASTGTPVAASPTPTPSASASAVAAPATPPTPLQHNHPLVGPEAASDQPMSWAPDTGGPGYEFREKLQSVLFNLLLIAALVVLCVKMLKRYLPGLAVPSRPGQPPPLMQVLAQQSLSSHVNLSLVKVCNKNVLIGFTEHSVNVLCEISEEELQASLTLPAQEGQDGAAVPAREPKEVYREILNHYLSIIPGFGSKR